MVLLPEPLGPASTRSLGWAEAARFASGLAAGLRSVGLLDTLECDARLHTLTQGDLFDDDGRAIRATLHHLPLARFHDNGPGEAERCLIGLVSRRGCMLWEAALCDLHCVF